MASTQIRRHQSSFSDRLKSLFRVHKQEARLSAARIRASGYTSFLTALVIAISLALPTSLHLLLNNVQLLLHSWDQQNNVTVFLDLGLSDNAARKLEQRIVEWPEVSASRYISTEDALQDFRKSSGLEEILANLDENPLPAALVLQPLSKDIEALEVLAKKLESSAGVDSVVVDTAWIARLNAILDVGKRFIYALGFALSCAVLLVIFNTIRLSISNRADEILITKLVGATDAFVRRPFLYTGFWFGLAGGVMALVLAESLVIALQGPVANLATLYDSDFVLQGVGPLELLAVPLIGLLVGLAGAHMAVSKHLQGLKPQ